MLKPKEDWKELPEDHPYADEEIVLGSSDVILTFTHQKIMDGNWLLGYLTDDEYYHLTEINQKIMEMDRKGMENQLLTLFQQSKKESKKRNEHGQHTDKE